MSNEKNPGCLDLHTEVTHIRHLKTHLHALFVAIAEATFRKSTEYRKSCREGGNNGDLQVRNVIMEPWQFPTVLPQQYSEYMTADWSNIVAWVTSLHEPEGSPRRWSWFQLYLDFQQRRTVVSSRIKAMEDITNPTQIVFFETSSMVQFLHCEGWSVSCRQDAN